MKRFETFLALTMLLFAIGFNLWLYRLEPSAKIDPNDNAFQYALVDRTNQIWDFAYKSCTSQEKDKSKAIFGSILRYPRFAFSLLTCVTPYLFDHWVPNWAEGYNLPFYYSHIPQIVIVGSYRVFSSFSQFLIFNFQFLMKISNFKFQISLFQYYHLIIYLLLSLFPLTVFLSLRLLRLPWLTAGVGALLATHLSTDGLYGLDPSSFLWRGYGLSSQLFAMIFLPLALAYSFRFFNDSEVRGKKFFKELKIRSFFPAVFFLFATTAGHLGIGIIAILSLPVLAFAKPIMLLLENNSISHVFESAKYEAAKLLLLIGVTLFFLSYWIVPILLNNNYHNISFWDPIWKFNSYGWKETMIRLFNGDLFDFGRLPILTALVFLGFFATLRSESMGRRGVSSTVTPFANVNYSRDNGERPDGYAETSTPTNAINPLAFLFPFWLLLYFGRTTWGGLIDLIPGMKEFHLSRFIVGLHTTGMFLAPLGVEAIVFRITYYVLWLKEKSKISIIHTTYPIIHFFITGILLVLLLPPVYRQTIKYNDLNNALIKKANENFMKVKPDVDELFRTLEPLKGNGRVFAGRGGSWGKDFRVAETPYYMHLSTYGVSTVLWLPETWSLNSDTEQYFSEDQMKDYELYNIRYVAAPPNQKPQPFWKLFKETASWKLYQIIPTGDTTGRDPGGVQPSFLKQQLGNSGARNAGSDGKEGSGRTRREEQNIFSYVTSGIRPAIVATDKESFINVVRLWIQSVSPNRGESDYPARGLFPELTFDKTYPKNTGLPNFKMIDEANYIVPDGTRHNLFAEPPVYMASKECDNANDITILSVENDSDMVFTATVDAKKTCPESILILKQTGHPNWQVTIDGKKAKRFDVFPFYNAVKVNEGRHEVIFEYKPSGLKIFLIVLEVIVVVFILIYIMKHHSHVTRYKTQDFSVH